MAKVLFLGGLESEKKKQSKDDRWARGGGRYHKEKKKKEKIKAREFPLSPRDTLLPSSSSSLTQNQQKGNTEPFEGSQ